MYTNKYSARFPLRDWCGSYANKHSANHYVAFVALATKKLGEKPNAQFIIIMFKMKIDMFTFWFLRS